MPGRTDVTSIPRYAKRISRHLVRQNAAYGVVICLLACVTGCGQPQIGSHEEGFRLVMRLNVAVMGKRAELLPPIVDSARQLRDEGKLSDAAFEVIKKIADSGMNGDWKGAQSTCLDFQKGQRAPRE